MCGFAGFLDFSKRPPDPERQALLERMGESIAARGPDECTYYGDELYGLVFRRLSIIDVTGGTQPIWNEDASKFVVVNGEIYNHLELRQKLRGKHTFRTNSDSEIVLHLFEEYGADSFRLLNGIYAAAIWDLKSRSLTLVRDRMGVKPLFYHRRNDSFFLFGSEIKSLLMHPDCPRDPNWVSRQLAEESSVCGVKALPGGHYAVLDAGGCLKIHQYWSLASYLNTYDDLKPTTPEEDAETYAGLLADSVKKQLMSDVPLGVFLSGGLDSSIVTAVAASVNNDIHCFNIAADADVDDGGDRQSAEQLTRKLNVALHQIRLTDQRLTSPTLEDLEHLVWILDGPLGNYETRCKLAAYARAKVIAPRLKVVLLGQGADEFAGGYSKGFSFAGASGRFCTDSWGEFVNNSSRQQIARNPLNRILPFLADGFCINPEYAYDNHVLDSARVLQKYNLWHEDRTSSHNGIEARVPFLDHRLVEFLVAVSPRNRAKLFWDKEIVRLAGERWLPTGLARRSKIPFVETKHQVGRTVQLQGVVKLFNDFRDKYLESSPFLSKQKVEKLWHDAQAGTPEAIAAGEQLDLVMQCAIFAAQCQRPHQYGRREATPPVSCP